MKFLLPTATLVACLATGAVASVEVNGTDSTLTRELQSTTPTQLYQMCGATAFVAQDRSSSTPNPVDCGINCQKTGCGYVTWNDKKGGTCYITDKIGVVVPNLVTVDPEAVSFYSSAYTGSSPELIALQANLDMPGYDIGTTNRVQFNLCVSDCFAISDCFAVTWTDYAGGTCWLKKRASSYLPKQGAISMVIARLATNPVACP